MRLALFGNVDYNLQKYGGESMSHIANIRLATVNDSARLLEIYGPYVLNTAVSFEYTVPEEAEFAKRINAVLEKFPWLVCEICGETAGYAYASMHKARAAYQWSVDTSVYVDPRYHGRYIGKALYTALFQMLKMQGYVNAYAGVTLPNAKSEGLHASFGFVPIGVFHHVGYKLGAWHDVKRFELALLDPMEEPASPKSINEIKGTDTFIQIIEDAAAMVKM
jgi:phosphinothricin acetyltransferase